MVFDGRLNKSIMPSLETPKPECLLRLIIDENIKNATCNSVTAMCWYDDDLRVES